MKLYILPGACSFAPHLVLNELGLAYEPQAVDRVTKRAANGRAIADINPKGQTPVLELDDGSILTEGTIISQYLADLKPEAGLIPPTGSPDRYRVQEWLNFIGADLHRSFGPFFNPAATDAEKDRARITIKGLLSHFERTLSGGQHYLTGDHFTVADAFAYTIIGWCRRVGIDLSTFPGVTTYLERIAARPSIKATLDAEARAQAELQVA
jgi:glutathione S-transferase